MIVDFKKINNDICVTLDLNLKLVFNNLDNLVLEKVFIHNFPNRYFVLKSKNAFSQNTYDVEIINDSSFKIKNLNNVNLHSIEESGCYSSSFVFIYNKQIYFFEITSGFYPQLDGFINLKSNIGLKITQNNNLLNSAFNNFYSDFFCKSSFKNNKSPCLFLFNTHYKNYNYLTSLKLVEEDIQYLKSNLLNVYISEPILTNNNILECLDSFCKNNNIKFNVNLCEFLHHDFKNQFTNLNFYNNDIFLKLVSYFLPRGIPPTHDTINKKFVCTTYRHHPSRYFILSFLSFDIDNVLLSYPKLIKEQGIINYSFVGESNIEPFVTFLQKKDFKCFNKLLRGFKNLKTNAPLFIDIKKVTKDNFSEFYDQENFFNSTIFECYNQSFCSIVCESVYDYFSPVLSEKLFMSFALKKPFILVGPKHSLRYVKELGFKTFSGFFNESYDDIECHNERMYKIFSLIDELSQLTTFEQSKILVDINEILEHNKNHVYNFFKLK